MDQRPPSADHPVIQIARRLCDCDLPTPTADELGVWRAFVTTWFREHGLRPPVTLITCLTPYDLPTDATSYQPSQSRSIQ